MLNPGSAPDLGFAITRSRRNGIDRLCLAGALDHSSVLLLEGELNAEAFLIQEQSVAAISAPYRGR